MIIASVVGARPQFIKAAAVSRALLAAPAARAVLIHTGQHYDDRMSRVFFEDLEIPEPDFDLGVGSASHGAQTGRMLEAVESALIETRPDWVLVYGDTNSTLAGALAAAKLHLPVAHVEAGLRSFNRRMPEEINRVVADHVSDLLFVPTEVAVANLRREGLPDRRIRLVGDVMYDTALHYGARAKAESRIHERLGLSAEGYVLATVHRAENTDDPERLRSIFEGLAAVAETVPVVVPLHPRTRDALERLGSKAASRVRVTDPVGYLDMLRLEQGARLVVTDSGGVQKEAFFFRVPCVTLRDETEWVELVEVGWNRLAPPGSAHAVASGVHAALADERPPEPPPGLYGGGSASTMIAHALLEGGGRAGDAGDAR